MKASLAFIGIALAFLSSARADDKKDEGRYGATPLKGDYYVYGGTLSEMLPPTRRDRKVSLMFTGVLAKDLFDQIGPDVKISCSGASDYRERNRVTSPAPIRRTTDTPAISASMFLPVKAPMG